MRPDTQVQALDSASQMRPARQNIQTVRSSGLGYLGDQAEILIRAVDWLIPFRVRSAECTLTALITCPNAADALSRLGLSLVALGRPEELLEVFRRSVAANPKSGQGQQNLANALLGSGRVEEAVGPAVMAATLRPADPAVHHLLGRIWAAQGKSGAAADEFRKAIQLGAPER